MGLDDASGNMIQPSEAADKYDFEEPLISFYNRYFMVQDDNENILNIIIKDLELSSALKSWNDDIIGNVQLINSVNKILTDKINLPNIFNRFYRIDKARTERSSGLGLAIVRGSVRAHEGNIKVESKLGKGTRFEIILPLNL